MGVAPRDHDSPDFSFKRFCRMMRNACRLRCPACGSRPMFVPFKKVRSLSDWFAPLDGCTKCGYPYEREPGYYLLSIFAINYGVGALLGLVIYLILDFWVQAPLWLTLTLTVLPIPLFNLCFARHSKSLFLAFDLFFDPHHREGGDGDQRVDSSERKPPAPTLKPSLR